MILVTATVESDLLDARSQCPQGDGLSDGCGGVFVSAVRYLSAQLLVATAGRSQRLARQIVDHLSINMAVTAMYAQPRTFGGAAHNPTDVIASPFALLSNSSFVVHDVILSVLSFSELSTQFFSYLFSAT